MSRLALRVFYCAAAIVALLPSSAEAQSPCSMPVSAYLTDTAGAPLDGDIDVELQFHVEAAPDSEPSECRSFAAVPVTSGWLRVDIDVCSEPVPGDCGTMPLSEVLRGAIGLWVAIVADGEEMGPRIAIGAVPYAVEASNSATLQGREPDAFEPTGAIEIHGGDTDGHHSATSDGIEITPVSVEVGSTRIESGSVDLGPAAADVLTSEIVQTLTDGGAADALHTHGGSHGAAGACYDVTGTGTCAEGFVRVSHGTLLVYYNVPVCMDVSEMTPEDEHTCTEWPFENVGCGPRRWQHIGGDVECATCCGWPVEDP